MNCLKCGKKINDKLCQCGFVLDKDAFYFVGNSFDKQRKSIEAYLGKNNTDLLSKKAEQGDTNAMMELGDIAYAENNTAAAINWYRRAVDAGNTDAIAKYNDIYQEELDIRIGSAISEGLSDEKLREFDAIHDLGQAQKWLEVNRPDYIAIVFKEQIKMSDEFGSVKSAATEKINPPENPPVETGDNSDGRVDLPPRPTKGGSLCSNQNPQIQKNSKIKIIVASCITIIAVIVLLKNIFPITKEFSPGDRVFFGEYYQVDNNGDGVANENDYKTEIEWKILEVNKDQALLISEKCLDVVPYHDSHKTIQWTECTINKWLNNDFLNEAFSIDQLNNIIVNSKSPYTGNRISLLSFEDIQKYLPTDESRIAFGTDFAYWKLANAESPYTAMSPEERYLFDISGAMSWWLLTEESGNNAFYLWEDGTLRTPYGDYRKAYVSYYANAVRPIIWVKTSALKENNNLNGEVKAPKSDNRPIYYNLVLQNSSDSTYNNWFGPEYVFISPDDAKNELINRLYKDPLLAAACLSQVDRFMGTMFSGMTYVSIKDDWANEINNIADAFVNNTELWDSCVGSFERNINNSATIAIKDIDEGTELECLIVGEGQKCPVVSLDTITDTKQLHLLQIAFNIKGTEIELCYVIEGGFSPVISLNK